MRESRHGTGAATDGLLFAHRRFRDALEFHGQLESILTCLLSALSRIFVRSMPSVTREIYEAFI